MTSRASLRGAPPTTPAGPRAPGETGRATTRRPMRGHIATATSETVKRGIRPGHGRPVRRDPHGRNQRADDPEYSANQRARSTTRTRPPVATGRRQAAGRRQPARRPRAPGRA